MEFLKAVSVAKVGLTVRPLEAVAEQNKPKPVSVMRVWGIVSGRKSGMSQFGAYTKFSGQIAAINLLTGDEYRSQDLLLPGIAEAVVNKMFEGSLKEENGSAQFALEVTVVYNPPKTENSNFTKFSYGVKPLIEFQGEDALSMMAKQLPAPAKQLSAPEGKKGTKK
jgi:hypothetical protein